MSLSFVRSLLFTAAASTGLMTALAAAMSCSYRPFPPVRELYSPELTTITSVDQAVDHIAARIGPDASQARTAAAIEEFVQRRFVHGFSEYRLCENWIAYIAGGIWYDLKVPIDPDEILGARRAMCSQSTLLTQALLARFGIEYAGVYFWHPPHMATAAKVDGEWLFYDGDLEPRRSGKVTMAQVLQGDVLETLYAHRQGDPDFPNADNLGTQFKQAALLGKIKVQDVNHSPGGRGRLFQQVTGLLSGYAWLFFALAFALTSPRTRPLLARLRGRRGPGEGAAASDGAAGTRSG